jgi:capsid portal protein
MQLRGTGKAWFKRVGVEEDIDSQTGGPLLETIDIPELLPTDKKTRANEVIWNTNYNSNNDYYGVPDILPAVGALYGDKSRTDYNIAFFSNYGIPTYAVTISGDFDDELVDPEDENSLTYLETAIQQHFRNIQQNPHSTLFLSVPSRPGAEGKVDIKFEPLSVETKEASFRLFRSDNRDEVITAHGMDPYRIGVTVTGSLGGNTAIESKKNYKSAIIQPRQESWEQLINQYIIREGFGITTWEFKFQSIDTEDEQSDLSIMERLFQLGAVSPNQLIRRFGDRYGLEEGEHESMNKHYLANRPLETEPHEVDMQVNLDTIKVLESLKADLLEMADDTSTADGNADRGIINRIKKVTNQ